MYAAPRSVFHDFHFVRRRVLFQEIGINREFRRLLRFDMTQRVAQSHVTVGAMMPISFAVGGNICELRPFPLVRKTSDDSLREVFATHENVFKGHGM